MISKKVQLLAVVPQSKRVPGSNPVSGWGPSVWSLYILIMSEWGISGFCAWLPVSVCQTCDTMSCSGCTPPLESVSMRQLRELSYLNSCMFFSYMHGLSTSYFTVQVQICHHTVLEQPVLYCRRLL